MNIYEKAGLVIMMIIMGIVVMLSFLANITKFLPITGVLFFIGCLLFFFGDRIK